MGTNGALFELAMFYARCKYHHHRILLNTSSFLILCRLLQLQGTALVLPLRLPNRSRDPQARVRHQQDRTPRGRHQPTLPRRGTQLRHHAAPGREIKAHWLRLRLARLRVVLRIPGRCLRATEGMGRGKEGEHEE